MKKSIDNQLKNYSFPPQIRFRLASTSAVENASGACFDIAAGPLE
jgi:hypothetical protein